MLLGYMQFAAAPFLSLSCRTTLYVKRNLKKMLLEGGIAGNA